MFAIRSNRRRKQFQCLNICEEKLSSLFSLTFEIPAILLLFLETKAHFEIYIYLLKQLSFSKKFPHLFLFRQPLSK